MCALRTSQGAIEFLSYSNATLTGPNQYTLTGLYRGLYGTYAIDLPAGSQFLLLAGPIFAEVLPAQFVGQTLYFEFPSFNLVGGGAQSLADTTIWEYTPRGSSVIPGVFPVLVEKDAIAPAEMVQNGAMSNSHLPLESSENLRHEENDVLETR